jgi:hypothetical protein
VSEDAHKSGTIAPETTLIDEHREHHDVCTIGYPRCALCCLHYLAVSVKGVVEMKEADPVKVLELIAPTIRDATWKITDAATMLINYQNGRSIHGQHHADIVRRMNLPDVHRLERALKLFREACEYYG